MPTFCKLKALAIPTILLLVLCGCSTFNRDWRRAVAQPPPANSPEGPWDGTWLSNANGHHGKLRCLMTHETNDLCEARFHATFGGIFHFNYTAQFEMQPHSVIGWEFNGEANLGKLGGTYYYEGRATATNLASTYKSKYDYGTFQLHRP
jgi:hypothetical protein